MRVRMAGIVAALDASCSGEVLHGRVVETLPPEHIKRAQSFLVRPIDATSTIPFASPILLLT